MGENECLAVKVTTTTTTTTAAPVEGAEGEVSEGNDKGKE